MKRFIIGFLVMILCVGFASAKVNQPDTSERNILIESPVGASGEKPTIIAKLVRYGRVSPNETGLLSGAVVQWDPTSADGITVSACTNDINATFAGVTLSSIGTADSIELRGPGSGDDNWGYVCIKGYCLARVDSSMANTGEALFCNQTTPGTFQTKTLSGGSATLSGESAGVLLSKLAADGLMPVIVKNG